MTGPELFPPCCRDVLLLSHFPTVMIKRRSALFVIHRSDLLPAVSPRFVIAGVDTQLLAMEVAHSFLVSRLFGIRANQNHESTTLSWIEAFSSR